MIVMKKIAVVMAVVENITVKYFFDLRNFGSRLVVGVDDTQVVVDKLDRVSFAFQTEDRSGPDPHDDAHLRGENSFAKAGRRHLEYEAYVSGSVMSGPIQLKRNRDP
ncbi:hypothetical protein Tco_0190712 [Tanacetum coccineum]